MKRLLFLSFAASFASGLHAQNAPVRTSGDFSRYAEKLRESAILQIPKVEPPKRTADIPTPAPSTTNDFSFNPRPSLQVASGIYPWKLDIVTTVFWVGERATVNNPVHNRSSSWDLNWASNFGGFDDPNSRSGYLPARFTPRLNPFYVALPYNDVTRGSTKPEARKVIPWFKRDFEKEGQSVCKDRWVEIRNRQTNKIAYAQWSDCGPFSTDHWQYVFGNDRPKPNLNRGAGLDVSPAVRDSLGLASTGVTDWRFVEERDVPPGPWRQWGDNNTFVQRARRNSDQVVINKTATPASSQKGAPGKPAPRSSTDRVP